MKLSEELEFRGFKAETTIENPESLDTRENKQFYWGADPSADSLTIGNLAALMMCACFVKHGYKPYLLVGGATGQIGDPKETGERDLKPLEEVERNKQKIKAQIERVLKNYADLTETKNNDLTLVDNLDWFKDINYLDFLRTVGKAFSMTQLLDRKFIQNRIGEGGSGISYAEFSYTLIQGYDFYHLYKEYGVTLQLCGADQFGNCSSGIHLIKRLENAEADAWSTPLVIDPVSGRKFGKSEGNAVWLASEGENSTTVFDFYQFWLNQPDTSVEYLMKFYTIYSPEEIAEILKEHEKAPEKRIAQKALAKSVTEVVHGVKKAAAAISATEKLFDKSYVPSPEDAENFAGVFPEEKPGLAIDVLANSGLATSKSDARKLIKAGAVSMNGEKITDENAEITTKGILKKGKNKFIVIN
ncbi:MAG: tyrosine--tRNA ligase [Candidatus Saccharibacteria bacterium]|nr:tyrosine--tRNA ligase [Candidatus Saccharibacteria bacterium]